MTAQESIQIFGTIVAADDDSVVTNADRTAFANDVKTFIAFHRRIENECLKIGAWLIEMQGRYRGKFAALCDEQLPGLKPSTRENYVALAQWKDRDIQDYKRWRTEVPSMAIRAELAKVHNRMLADGCSADEIRAAIEARYPEVYARRNHKSLLGDGNGDEQLPADSTDAIRAVAPGLAILVDAGKVHPAEAERIIRAAAKSDFDAAETVRLFGVRDTASVDTLDKIAKSLTNSPERALGHVADIFRQMRTTDGFVTLPEGEQVHVADLSARELWSAYANASKEHEASDDKPKALTVLTEEINTNDVTRIAKLLEADTVLKQMRDMPENVWFSLTIKTIPVEE